ncbi:MAG: NERD protein [uncultured bacterium]|nr:MAG: NERD protein [uncultured bacterium]
MPPNVTKDSGFVSYIKSFRESVFSEVEVADLLQRIESGRLALTSNTAREHIRTLKARENPDAQRLCPRCGSKLIVRTVKNGVRAGQKFWGCSAFPRCKMVQEYR